MDWPLWHFVNRHKVLLRACCCKKKNGYKKGQSNCHQPQTFEAPSPPLEAELYQATRNPFKKTFNLNFSLPVGVSKIEASEPESHAKLDVTKSQMG